MAGLELKGTLVCTEVPDESEKVLEPDEPWSFVCRKSDKAWVWLYAGRLAKWWLSSWATGVGRPVSVYDKRSLNAL